MTPKALSREELIYENKHNSITKNNSRSIYIHIHRIITNNHYWYVFQCLTTHINTSIKEIEEKV